MLLTYHMGSEIALADPASEYVMVLAIVRSGPTDEHSHCSCFVCTEHTAGQGCEAVREDIKEIQG